MIVRLSLVIVLASCGRIGFDAAPPPSPPNDAPTTTIDAPAVSCPGGNCTCTSDCDVTCGIVPCNITCTDGATCNIRCETSPCEVECENGAICNYSCPIGGCSITVREGGEATGTCSSSCTVDCDVSAGACQQTCILPLTCQCNGC